MQHGCRCSKSYNSRQLIAWYAGELRGQTRQLKGSYRWCFEQEGRIRQLVDEGKLPEESLVTIEELTDYFAAEVRSHLELCALFSAWVYGYLLSKTTMMDEE